MANHPRHYGRCGADIYNLFNDDSVLLNNLRYGSAYLRPVQIMAGRMFKFGFQLDY